jgi:hypothetical protein
MRPLIAWVLVSLVSASASASCQDTAERLFGFSLGPTAGYTEKLISGLRREGTAEVIAGVGFESIEGQSHGIEYARIMAFYDRGQFVTISAVGSMKSQPDHASNE